jgi:hypothetical protein
MGGCAGGPFAAINQSMRYTSGNYEAFARPRKPAAVEGKTAWSVGAGLKRIFGLVDRSYYLSSITWFFVVSIELARIGK